MSKRIPILIPRGRKIILFDGVCNLCDGFVQFVLKRDKKALFLFASLQSDIGRQLLEKHQVSHEALSTVVLIDGNEVYTHSDVPLRIAKGLGGIYSLVYPFKILPKKIRNHIYNWIARNRYGWFGKKESCMLPKREWRNRFLDVL